MNQADQQARVLAQAILEIRVLLSAYLGDAEADVSLRTAAHIAYALHNDAEAVLSGRSFDPQEAIASMEQIDIMFEESLQRRFSRALSNPA